MKRLQVLRRVLRETGADKIWTGFLVQFFLSAAVIWLREPDMPRYGDALWYCYAVVTTIGFGDIVAQHFLSRVLSVLLSISAALVIALVTGVFPICRTRSWNRLPCAYGKSRTGKGRFADTGFLTNQKDGV